MACLVTAAWRWDAGKGPFTSDRYWPKADLHRALVDWRQSLRSRR